MPTDTAAVAKTPPGRPQLDRAVLYDKVLGMLLGSAIGDAMGAPTEMWSRRDIMVSYGVVNRLDTMVRAPSAEGTWDYNLPAGGTTDDTRWKKLTAEFLLKQRSGFGTTDQLKATDFARHLVDTYRSHVEDLRAVSGYDPESFETVTRRMAWLQEWVPVAEAFVGGNPQTYGMALSKFYGGEVTCAGMLYSPMIGAYYSGKPTKAYEAAYELSIFDLGYARDISALTGAMVATAMSPHANQSQVFNVLRDVDPQGYFKSRLVGRSAYRILQEAQSIVHAVRQLPRSALDSLYHPYPHTLPIDTLYWGQMQQAYAQLELRNQDLPFHAAEIHLVNLTALLLSDFDFEKALVFVVNYGRDNDTTGAVTGAILGAYWGADKLPPSMKEAVLRTDASVVETSLKDLAARLTDQIINQLL
ncbi:MAG: ADP-ribosylglycohydrolase family protein [Tunicatimonas sp.]